MYQPVSQISAKTRSLLFADQQLCDGTQYLVDRRGFPVKHYASAFEERVLEADILTELRRATEDADATSTA